MNRASETCGITIRYLLFILMFLKREGKEKRLRLKKHLINMAKKFPYLAKDIKLQIPETGTPNKTPKKSTPRNTHNKIPGK